MRAGRAADVWGCGCVLFAMLDGTIPFTEWCGPDGCIVFEGRDWWEYPMPDAFPTEAKDLVHKKPVYANESQQRELALIPRASTPTHYHSLLAELGGSIARYREFVQFHESRICLEYILAYRRQ